MELSVSRRRSLRRRTTDAEAALWLHLRGRRLAGFKFRRQHPCGPFILDFFCAERRLAIELRGGQHYQPRARSYDTRRDRFLAGRSIVVLRFPCDQIFRETDAVLATIAFALGGDGPSPRPSPRQAGRGR